MKNEYIGGGITASGKLWEEALYDAGNNAITAQFDGRGAISRYAVMNKYEVFSKFYTLLTIDSVPLDYMREKKAEMIGKRQITTVYADGAEIEITQFLDGKHNCIYVQYAVTAARDIDFEAVMNFGINYQSYVDQLPGARLTAGNLLRIIGGFLGGKKQTQERDGEALILRGKVMGDFYLDAALSRGGKMGEADRGFFNQFAVGGKVKKGEKGIFRYVISAGTRGDYTFCDVKDRLKNFDAAMKEAQEYIDSLVCPAGVTDPMEQAYYKSLLNCSLSNYKELGKFKGFLAGIVYQFPARTYYRDGYWTVLSVLPVKPELVRNEIITLAHGINKKGECGTAVRYNFKCHWGNHYDSPSFFVIMTYDYLVHTGDMSVLNESVNGASVYELICAVLERFKQEVDGTGLLVKGGKYNRRDWCDNVFRGGYVTYDEALYCRALQAAGEISAKLGRKEKAAAFEKEYARVKDAINKLLWNEEKGWYNNYVDGDFTEDNLSIDTVIVALFGIASEERAKRMLSNMEKWLETRNNKEQGMGDWGTMSVYPYYKRAWDIVQKSSLPAYYHNGGDWPYWSNIYAYAKLAYGMDYKYPLLRWFEYNVEKGNYTPVEFYSPIHPDGSLLQAWSSTGAFVMSYSDGTFFTKGLK